MALQVDIHIKAAWKLGRLQRDFPRRRFLLEAAQLRAITRLRRADPAIFDAESSRYLDTYEIWEWPLFVHFLHDSDARRVVIIDYDFPLEA